jgi:hypothetical protein
MCAQINNSEADFEDGWFEDARLNRRDREPWPPHELRAPLHDVWNGFRREVESFRLRVDPRCDVIVSLFGGKRGKNRLMSRRLDNTDGTKPIVRRFEIPRKKDNKATRVYGEYTCYWD